MDRSLGAHLAALLFPDRWLLNSVMRRLTYHLRAQLGDTLKSNLPSAKLLVAGVSFQKKTYFNILN